MIINITFNKLDFKSIQCKPSQSMDQAVNMQPRQELTNSTHELPVKRIRGHGRL